QREEFRYYTGEAWQPGGNHGGIDPEDVQQLVGLNTGGRLQLVDGDDVEIFPGIRAYTGARHTYASQYLRVDGDPPSSWHPTIAISIAISPNTKPALPSQKRITSRMLGTKNAWSS